MSIWKDRKNGKLTQNHYCKKCGKKTKHIGKIDKKLINTPKEKMGTITYKCEKCGN